MPAVAPFKTTDNGWLTKWELHDRPTGLASRWCAPAWLRPTGHALLCARTQCASDVPGAGTAV